MMIRGLYLENGNSKDLYETKAFKKKFLVAFLPPSLCCKLVRPYYPSVTLFFFGSVVKV